jgi:hypothetical protein
MAPPRRRRENRDRVLERRSIITLTAATRTHGRNDSEIAVNNQSFRKSSGSFATLDAIRHALAQAVASETWASHIRHDEPRFDDAPYA